MLFGHCELIRVTFIASLLNKGRTLLLYRSWTHLIDTVYIVKKENILLIVLHNFFKWSIAMFLLHKSLQELHSTIYIIGNAVMSSKKLDSFPTI